MTFIPLSLCWLIGRRSGMGSSLKPCPGCFAHVRSSDDDRVVIRGEKSVCMCWKFKSIWKQFLPMARILDFPHRPLDITYKCHGISPIDTNHLRAKARKGKSNEVGT